jgi:uncharacterized protein
MKITYKKMIFIALIFIGLIAFLYHQNNAISVTKISIESSKIPASFDEYKIVHLSDLHSKLFGEDQKRLVKKIRESEPDLIVYTGDLIDKRRDERPSYILMEELVNIVPVYFVTGNHEWDDETAYGSLETELKRLGVHVLRNQHDTIQIGNDEVYILGVDDPLILENDYETEILPEEAIESVLNQLPNENNFTLLLSHRTELFEMYAQYDIDLTFSGHAHGGQFRLPFIGGLFAPNQGYFPKYTSGKHRLDDSQLVISRGLGNSNIPQRIFNLPEIVVVTLKSQPM